MSSGFECKRWEKLQSRSSHSGPSYPQYEGYTILAHANGSLAQDGQDHHLNVPFAQAVQSMKVAGAIGIKTFSTAAERDAEDLAIAAVGNAP